VLAHLRIGVGCHQPTEVVVDYYGRNFADLEPARHLVRSFVVHCFVLEIVKAEVATVLIEPYGQHSKEGALRVDCRQQLGHLVGNFDTV
jgi:hypothetical protein